MKFTRRQALRMIGTAVPTIAVSRSIEQTAHLPSPEGVDVTAGKYAGTRDSLKAYQLVS